VLRLEALSAKGQDQVGKLWSGVEDVSDASQARFSQAAAKSMVRLREASADGTVSYLSEYERRVTGLPVVSDVDTGEIAETLRGVDPVEVYARPFITARTALANGALIEDALKAGLNRALTMADTDVTLSQNVAAQEHMQQRSRITGYRRMPDGNACPLCVMASTQRYTTGTLQGIHDHCHCGIIPIIGSSDPGRVIDKQRLADLKADLGMTTKPNPNSAYKKFVKVEDHGELGSVLSLKKV
jgi:hypothetical protein